VGVCVFYPCTKLPTPSSNGYLITTIKPKSKKKKKFCMAILLFFVLQKKITLTKAIYFPKIMAISHVSWLKIADISGGISVPIIRI
jgi:hypothetical protein